MKRFGESVKYYRGLREITLRQFCKDLHLDAANWSKTERGLLNPPNTRYRIMRIANRLGLNTFQTNELLLMAAIDYIPKDLRPSDMILKNILA